MLPNKNVDRTSIPTDLHDMKRSELGDQFAKLHRQLQETQKSMLVIVDGWEASGKGFLLKDLTRELDPKHYEVAVFEESTLKDAQRPYLRRFFMRAPKRGQIVFFDRSFYYDLFHQLNMKEKRLNHLLNDISFVEKSLTQDDTLVVKFFIHHSKDEMSERIKALKKEPYRKVLVTEEDEDQLKNYKAYRKHFIDILAKTNFKETPWHILHIDDQKDQSRLALKTCIDSLTDWLAKDLTRPQKELHFIDHSPNIVGQIDHSPFISQEDYDDIKEDLQKQAANLLFRAYQENKGVIVVYEGSDAAGKGGNYQRLTRLMDPRGYDVATVAAPNDEEIRHHYLWRFYRDFPSLGRMTIFDRSWYGRVLVERIEGLTPVYRWQEAYAEINQMEHNITNQDYLLLKYLIVIDKDTQYDRFMGREKDPDKQYKITDEDWRNRDKFGLYNTAMNEMLAATSTKEAPWKVISGVDKRYARITVLKDFIKRMEAFLAK
ncbi:MULTISPECIES: phosphate:AMP phosphotransferase [Aerococcus]|uniref:Phosphate:AMP phosphotransferase n=1 Tax=Aerococcus viridans TaxID=1377 RepID=A0A2N6UGT1_9LACT|nr:MULTISPECIES: phosphate:AMP phosphotransferase [Aerococcus]OFU53435.1 phosphate:AMP phosphotransferase [Aerococcus sp. HMSC10H05]PMC80714.1 phosphate:AMP phosphotransferase [Aerococcus viridans]